MKKFIITDVLKFGWEKTKKNYGKVFTVLLIVILFMLCNNFLDYMLDHSFDVWSKTLFVFTQIGLGLLGLIVSINIIREGLIIVRGGHGNLRNIFRQPEVFWKYLFGQILTAIIIFAGLILLVVPGIILALRLFFIKPLIVDQKLGPVDAIKKGFDMTRGWTWGMFLFALSLIVLNAAGALVIGIGLFVTIPISFFAVLRVYDIFAASTTASHHLSE